MHFYHTRRSALKNIGLLVGSYFLSGTYTHAEIFLTPSQAKQLILGKTACKKQMIHLTKDQASAIKSASKVRVNKTDYTAYKTKSGDWLIFDQIIGKHENIDIAIGIDNKGAITGIEVLVYRETYGHEIRDKNWRAQFNGKNNSENLKLDKQIKNISGATLSCSHITDAVNRWTHTWDLVLKNM